MRFPRGWVLSFVLHFIHVMHIISCHHVHFILHTRSSHASEHFPRCPFCNLTLLCPPAPPFASFRVRVLNILGMYRDLPSGPGLPPVDCLSSFVSFGLRLILQRLTEGPRRPRVCCSPTPFQFGPKTHLNLFHHLGRSITIVCPKTAPHLELPSSLYLYK